MDQQDRNAAGHASDADRALIEGVLGAYREGLFPMADPDGSIAWYAPDPRALLSLEPGGFHVSRSLRRRVRSGRFEVTTDRAFAGVVAGCAEPRPGREQTWLDARIRRVAITLHDAGHAHSIEAWLPATDARERTLVGGVYGIALGGVFFAESMFSRPEFGGTDASKVALVHLVAHLRSRGFAMLDVQFTNRFLEQFGIVEVDRDSFMGVLSAGADRAITWGPLADRPSLAWEDGPVPADA